MEKQTAGRENLGKLAPKFAELNDDILFASRTRRVKNANIYKKWRNIFRKLWIWV